MKTFLFAGFFVGSQLGVLVIFHFTTYFRLFWKFLPLLILYSVVLAWCFTKLQLDKYFLWQVALSLAWLFTNWFRQVQARKSLLSKVGKDPEMLRIMESGTSKIHGHYIASAFVYLGVFVATYLWLVSV